MQKEEAMFVQIDVESNPIRLNDSHADASLQASQH
jgi:hypothetical protein